MEKIIKNHQKNCYLLYDKKVEDRKWQKKMKNKICHVGRMNIKRNDKKMKEKKEIFKFCILNKKIVQFLLWKKGKNKKNKKFHEL